MLPLKSLMLYICFRVSPFSEQCIKPPLPMGKKDHNESDYHFAFSIWHLALSLSKQHPLANRSPRPLPSRHETRRAGFSVNFLAPAAFWFAATLPVVVVFYLLKRKRVVKLVSSTLLWQKFLADTQANAPFQKLRRPIKTDTAALSDRGTGRASDPTK